jgi:hypothetical protein
VCLGIVNPFCDRLPSSPACYANHSCPFAPAGGVLVRCCRPTRHLRSTRRSGSSSRSASVRRIGLGMVLGRRERANALIQHGLPAEVRIGPKNGAPGEG